MKGRSTFTSYEINELKRLINRKNSLPSEQQKAIRDQMRDIGFYITDFSPKKGFESKDLDLLIHNGVVKISDSNTNKYEPEQQQIQVSVNPPIQLKHYDSSFLERHRFTGSIKYLEYKENPGITRRIPNVKGLYIVITPSLQKDFLEIGTGGHFKDKDPNVPLSVLDSNWVCNSHILYIGKAGGISENRSESNSTLRRRLNTYFKFGQGEPVGHWGGRLIWQLRNTDELLFYWRPCDEDENPVELEHQLIAEFKSCYVKRPFANLKD